MFRVLGVGFGGLLTRVWGLRVPCDLSVHFYWVLLGCAVIGGGYKPCHTEDPNLLNLDSDELFELSPMGPSLKFAPGRTLEFFGGAFCGILMPSNKNLAFQCVEISHVKAFDELAKCQSKKPRWGFRVQGPRFRLNFGLVDVRV